MSAIDLVALYVGRSMLALGGCMFVLLSIDVGSEDGVRRVRICGFGLGWFDTHQCAELYRRLKNCGIEPWRIGRYAFGFITPRWFSRWLARLCR